MLKAVCITDFVQGPGRFHVITVKYPSKIPGQIEDIDGGCRYGIWYLEDTAVEPDGGVIVDATFSLHTEQVSDIGHLGQFPACVLSGQSFLKWAYAKTAVDALVVMEEIENDIT